MSKETKKITADLGVLINIAGAYVNMIKDMNGIKPANEEYVTVSKGNIATALEAVTGVLKEVGYELLEEEGLTSNHPDEVADTLNELGVDFNE
jgi:hypothetical protein